MRPGGAPERVERTQQLWGRHPVAPTTGGAVYDPMEAIGRNRDDLAG
jgi:hypothetical protein